MVGDAYGTQIRRITLRVLNGYLSLIIQYAPFILPLSIIEGLRNITALVRRSTL